MARSKYFQKAKDVLPEGSLTVEEALSQLAPKVEVVKKTEVVTEVKQVEPEKDAPFIRKAYDVFFDRSTMSYKIVTIDYDLKTNKEISEVKDLGRNQAMAASTIQKIFAMKFLKRKG